jgi:glyoxylase-like metal-dependent hydrolase (beta-lactamase superfamily II)
MAHRLTPLTEHLWVMQSELFQTNHGVFLDQDAAALIDPGLTPNTLMHIARFVVRQKASPTAIVLTHGHWDHILGPEHFAGVPVIAHADYREVIEAQGDRLRQ